METKGHKTERLGMADGSYAKLRLEATIRHVHTEVKQSSVSGERKAKPPQKETDTA